MNPISGHGQDQEPVVLTVRQASRLLQCSENHVYSLVSQGKIPHLRLDKLIRIPRWGLLQFIAAQSGTIIPALTAVDSSPIQSVDALQVNNEEGNHGER